MNTELSWGWSQTLAAPVEPPAGTVIVATPGFEDGKTDTAKAEVSVGSQVVPAEGYSAAWAADFTTVTLTNLGATPWDAGALVYVYCPHLPLSGGGSQADIDALEARVTALEGRVTALEAPAGDAQRGDAQREDTHRKNHRKD